MPIESHEESGQPGGTAGSYPLKQPAGVEVSSISSRIRGAREAARLTQVELANKLKLDRTTVAGWEGGVGKPRMNKLAELAEAMNVSVDWLQFGDAGPPGRNGTANGAVNEVEARRRELTRRIRDLSLELDDTYT